MGLAPMQARLDALAGRLDALKRRCSTGYGCGSACISVKKECRSNPAAATSKERLQRLGQLAKGELKPRGIGVPKAEEARAMAAELQAQRQEQQAVIKAERKRRRQGQGATESRKNEKQASPAKPSPVEARRSRPKERISFEQPIVGPTGAKLTGYSWQWTLEEVPDKEGELVEKRVSNWEESLPNVETGRNVVHQFEVQVGGDTRVVSAESALKLLGFMDADDKKRFGSLKSTARTVARLRMALQLNDDRQKRFEADWGKVSQLPRPEVMVGNWRPHQGDDDIDERTWQMGEATEVELRFPKRGRAFTDEEMTGNVQSQWLNQQMKALGWGEGRRWWHASTERDRLARTRDDLQKRLNRAERKLQAATRSDSPSSRLDALQARLDALKRRCTTGYACGAACISPAKECRAEGGKASTGKERLRRLQELAQGAAPGSGIGQPRGQQAAAKAQQIQAARNQQARQLRTARANDQQQAQEKAAAAAAKARKALRPSPPPVAKDADKQEGPRPAPPPGGSASNPKQAFEAAAIELGRGMFGAVRLGQDGLVIKRGVLTQPEIRALKHLESSPVAPRLHAVQTTEGSTAFRKGKNGYMVMDAAKGDTLNSWITSAARGPEELREAFSGMLRVRKALHTAGVAHNDMHASNLFWDATTKQMTAIDFGMARIDPTAALIEALGTARGVMKFNKVEAPGDYQSRSTIQALNRGRAQTGNPDWKRFQANRRRVEALLKAEGAGELISRSIRSVPKNNPLTKQRAAELIQMLYEGL